MITLGPYEFTDTDAHRTFTNLGELWIHMTYGLAEVQVPVPVAACGEALMIADGLAAALGDREAMSTGPTDASHLTPEILAQRLGTLGQRASERWSEGGWDRATAAAALEAAWVSLRGIGFHLRSAGLFGTEQTGTVAQINVSGGGAPKTPVDAVAVDYAGIIGDTQKSRQHHGRPWQALSLWSAEVIHSFQADGHPISPGAAGENLTVSGLDWATIRPGMVLQIGEVLCELSSYTMPCTKIAQWFSDGDYRQIDYRRGPVSRIYATVLVPGRIATGDAVIVEPASVVN
jgi:MOSC domain-containing protein YiiM